MTTDMRLESDEQSSPYFDGCARGVLLLRLCSVCGSWSSPQALACPRCYSGRLRWAGSSGHAVLRSWSLVPPSGGSEERPKVVGIVETAEGPWVRAEIVGVTDAVSLQEGLRLEVGFDERFSRRIPHFTPLAVDSA